jgi:hypothetical protein
MVVNPRKTARPRHKEPKDWEPKGRDPEDWRSLSEETQLRIATAALRRATARVAAQAEGMAEIFDEGGLPDQGGADALRLFVRLLRLEAGEPAAPGAAETAGSAWPAGFAPAGHA